MIQAPGHGERDEFALPGRWLRPRRRSAQALMGVRRVAVLLQVLLQRLIEMPLVQHDDLAQLFVERGTPAYLRSDNGPEFVAKAVREWLPKVRVRTLYIEPGSPRENGYLDSFNGKLRDELLAREVFDTLLEAKVLVARWRRHYNLRVSPVRKTDTSESWACSGSLPPG